MGARKHTPAVADIRELERGIRVCREPGVERNIYPAKEINDALECALNCIRNLREEVDALRVRVDQLERLERDR